MELMNFYRAVVIGAWLAEASCVIGSGMISSVASKVGGFQCDNVKMSGTSGSCAAIGNMLSGRRVLLENGDARLLAQYRMPAVNVTSRPINWSVVLSPSTCQEALDYTTMSYAIAESISVMLPVSIVIPGFGGDVYQATEIPGQKMVKNVVGKLRLDPKHMRYGGIGLSDMLQMQKSMESVEKTMRTVSEAWKKRFRRTLEPVEKFMMDDAEIAIIAYGPSCGNAKIAVKKLRAEGEKVGLLRLIMLRPVPEAEISAALQKISRIGIVDTQVSLGGWSKLYQSIRTFYNGFATNLISDELISVNDFVDMFKRLKSAAKNERVWMVK